MASILSAIIAIFKAIPVIERLFVQLMALYIKSADDAYKRRLKEGIEKAINGDTTDLEKAIGSPRAGKPSGEKDSKFKDGVSHED